MANDGGRCCGCESERLSRVSALTETFHAGSRRVAKSRGRALCGDEMRGQEGIVAAFEHQGQRSFKRQVKWQSHCRRSKSSRLGAPRGTNVVTKSRGIPFPVSPDESLSTVVAGIGAGREVREETYSVVNGKDNGAFHCQLQQMLGKLEIINKFLFQRLLVSFACPS